jgi:ligand-binding sensor domain-containing protein
MNVKFTNTFIIFLFCLLIVLNISPLFSRKYNPSVWTTYGNFNSIYTIVITNNVTYFGTDGGILRYDRMKNQWDLPITKSNDFPGDITQILAYDSFTNKIWILTDSTLAIYIPQISFWERKIARVGLPTTVITSIGFTQDKIFLARNNNIYVSQRGSYFWEKWMGSMPQNIVWYGEKNKISVKDYPFLTPYYVTDKYFNRYEYSAIAVENKDIWLGTYGYGVFHNNKYTWQGTHYITGLATSRVDAIFKDENSYWLGGNSTASEGSGITFINFQSGEGKHYRAEDVHRIDSDNVFAIAGNKHTIWFGTDAGLLRYDKKENLWKNYSLFSGLPENTVLSLILKNDTLFIGTYGGMAIFSLHTNEMETIGQFDNISINSFAIYNDHLLIATDDGVFLMREKKFETITDPDGDFSFGVKAMFVDENAIWFGTRRSGVDVYYPDSLKWEEFLYPTTICGQWVYAITGDSDYIWVGTDNGLARYSKKMNIWKTFNETDGLADNEIRALYLEKDYLWIGTKNGLTRFEYKDSSVPP